jgi:hypothetical protein
MVNMGKINSGYKSLRNRDLTLTTFEQIHVREKRKIGGIFRYRLPCPWHIREPVCLFGHKDLETGP